MNMEKVKKALWVSEEAHLAAKLKATSLGMSIKEYIEKFLSQPKPKTKDDGTDDK